MAFPAAVSKELFLSYGRELEVIQFVKRLKEDLELNGFSVWLDSDEISSGSDWHGAIGTGLDNCKAVVAVITNKYVVSHYCKGELYTADGDKKLIFPVFLEDVDLSSTELSRGVKYIISGINWTFFRSGIEDYNASLGKLTQGMKEKGLGSRGDVDDTDSGKVTVQMSKLHLSPNQSSAPPPTAQMPSPQHPPLPYGHNYTPPHMAPQPYYNTPNPMLPPSPPQPYYSTPSPMHPPSAPQPYYSTSPVPPPSAPQPYYSTSPMPPQPYYAYPSAPYTTSPPTTGYYPPAPGNIYQTPPTAPTYNTPPLTTGYYPPVSANFYQTPPNNHTHHPALSSQVPVPEPPPPYKISEAQDTPSQAAAVKKPEPDFKVGMKLEAVDQRFPYFVCVATVMDKKENGDKLLIHFDGWAADYNYWCSRDDLELHPAGWCDKQGWQLQSPHGQSWESWPVYLKETHSEKAPMELFIEDQLVGPCSLLFATGMKIEAKDWKHPTLVCAASICDIRPGEVKVHFDGWGSEYDYWCDSGSADIHPCMWSAKQLNKQAQPPKGYEGDFKWNQYLAGPGIRPAPAHLFNAAQRSGGNKFQIGMRLEAKDRLYPTLVAVATVADIKDEQILVHFDGWTSKYDYWCRPDCVDIHPRGWCDESLRDLQSPKDYVVKPFSWSEYLSAVGAIAAPKNLFTSSQLEPENKQFDVGMKLEAKDRKNPTMICVATVIDKDDMRLLIHFDGWSDSFDYWCEPDSTDIHPVGWCETNHGALQPPHNYGKLFDWNEYLLTSGAVAAPEELFTPAQSGGSEFHTWRGNDNDVSDSNDVTDSDDVTDSEDSVDYDDDDDFQVGMKLEAKDRKNPTMMCVATVIDKDGKRLLIHFDGWSANFDYWCGPDSGDLHPKGWCERQNKQLQPPKSYGRSFHWDEYLRNSGAIAAPKLVFTKAQCGGNDFHVGMKLEAKDRKTPSLVCVVTIIEIEDDRLLIHFDGWTDTYDYWCDSDTSDIHPVGWCAKLKKHKLQEPKGYGSGHFNWNAYLKETHSIAAPSALFNISQTS